MKNQKRTRKKAYITAILLILSALGISGCFVTYALWKLESLPAYSSTKALDLMEQALKQGNTEFQIQCAYEQGLEEKISEDLKEHFRDRYLMRCLLEDISMEHKQDGSLLTVSCNMSYTDTAVGCGPVNTVRSEAELEQVLADSYLAHLEKTAILLDQFQLSDEEFFDHMDNAEINCSLLACEATDLTYVRYDSEDGLTLFLAWAGFPIGIDALQEGQEQLLLAIEEAAASISSELDAVGQYREIYDYLLEHTQYDDNIQQSTLMGDSYVTSEMHMQRSAYGALIGGNTVCTGYARAYKAICDHLGLPCYTLLGSYNGIQHAWNAVPVDGETKYIDCTLADTGSTQEQTFLFTEEQKNSWGYIEKAFCRIPW